MDITELVKVRLSPFDVAAHLDRGYRASNTVSGSRFDAPIRELPFAIQAFTEVFIADQRPVTLFDVARYSPGVTYRSNDFNEGDANVAIRGFAVSQVAGAPQVLRDGHNGPSVMGMVNVSRVEVVKGPSSFLYGQVAPGGIVNVITKSPQPRFAAWADVSYGSYGQHRAQVDLTGPLSSTLFFRVTADHDQDMHYWDPYDAHASTIAPSLLWKPSDRFSLSVRYESFQKRESPPVMQKPGYGRQRGVVPTPGDPNRDGEDVPGLPDSWNSMAGIDYRRSDARGTTAWADLKLDDHWNVRGSFSRQAYAVALLFSGNLGMANNSTFLQGRRLRQQVYDNHDQTTSIDAVGQYRFGAASLRLLLGAQRVSRRFDSHAGQAPNDPALGNDPVASPLPLWDLRDPSTWNREVNIPLTSLTVAGADRSARYADGSLYAGSTLGFFDDRLLVLAGLRSTSTRAELTDKLALTTQNFSSRKVTPQYGILYRLTPEISTFASYAESFVPGQQLLLRPDGSSAPAEPTQGRGFDLGVKAELMDGRVSGTLTLFNLRNTRVVNDLATTNAEGAVVITNVQSGEQRSRGLEVAATVQLIRDWQVYLSYSYMDARIVEFSGQDAQILAQDPATLDAAGRANYKNVYLLHGARLQMSAPHLANLWTRYELGGGAYVGGGFNFVKNQTLLPASPASLRQSYVLLNALAGYAWTAAGQRLSVELTGRNLGDAHYRPSQSTRSRPREVLVSLKVVL
ncbi:TonB-dependent receptor [Roseateles sp.]|uniref:TonB-dependent siderophore receptor n=1 Tax=Roseateles sp. TaxID=1971397 RepID=UPI0032640B92